MINKHGFNTAALRAGDEVLIHAKVGAAGASFGTVVVDMDGLCVIIPQGAVHGYADRPTPVHIAETPPCPVNPSAIKVGDEVWVRGEVTAPMDSDGDIEIRYTYLAGHGKYVSDRYTRAADVVRHIPAPKRAPTVGSKVEWSPSHGFRHTGTVLAIHSGKAWVETAAGMTLTKPIRVLEVVD